MNALRRTAVLLAAALLVPNLVACASAMAKDNTQTNAVSSDSTSFSQRSAVTISTPSLTSCPYDTSVEPKNPQIASTTQVTYAPSPETVDTLPSREQTTVELPLTTPEESTVTTIRIEQSVPETTAPQSATTVPVTGQPEMTEKPKIPEPITFDTPVIDALPNWDKDRTVVHYNDFKAMWISQYDLYGIYTNNGSQRE